MAVFPTLSCSRVRGVKISALLGCLLIAVVATIATAQTRPASPAEKIGHRTIDIRSRDARTRRCRMAAAHALGIARSQLHRDFRGVGGRWQFIERAHLACV